MLYVMNSGRPLSTGALGRELYLARKITRRDPNKILCEKNFLNNGDF